jgi:hypothetical protein
MSAFMRALKQQLDDEEPEAPSRGHGKARLREPIVKLDDETYVVLLSSKFNRASLAGAFQVQCLFGAVDVSSCTLCAQHECPATVRQLQKQTFRLQPSRRMTIATETETPVVIEMLWDVQGQSPTATQPPPQRTDVSTSKQLINAINDLAAFAIAAGNGKDKVALVQLTFQKQQQLFSTSLRPTASASSTTARSTEPPAKRGKYLRQCPRTWMWDPRQSSLVIGQDWSMHTTTLTKLHKRWVKRQRSVSDGDNLPRWPSAIVMGAKGVGKSTFARYLCNKCEGPRLYTHSMHLIVMC